MSESTIIMKLGVLQAAVDRRLTQWQNDSVVQRMWEKDTTLWSSEPVAELADRLGWLDLPVTMPKKVAEIVAFVDDIKAAGFTRVVLLGMGGSSLAPELFQRAFGNATGYPKLHVLDSTHPGRIHALTDRIDVANTVFVVSSKSGSTIETMSFFHHFWDILSADGKNPGANFVAITDPGSSLEKLAEERGFRRVWNAPPDVGGRYSSLCEFGMVPAAMIGVDIGSLLVRAAPLAPPAVFTTAVAENPGLLLGAIIGEAALAGRDKLTILAADRVAALPDWIEQLVAESTGKNGKGVVPITNEPVLDAKEYGDDRLFVSIEVAGEPADDLDAVVASGHPVIRILLADTLDVGREFYQWEVATAAASMILGVQPFDQPDVQLAKALASKAMNETGRSEAATRALDASAMGPALNKWMADVKAGDYVSVHAYIAPDQGSDYNLARLAVNLRKRMHLPVTVEYGPRFLHSTGQLHKGGADNGVFLQIVDVPEVDLPVPTTTYTFGQLIAAQAAGDAAALVQRGRRMLTVSLESMPWDSLIDATAST